MADMERDVRWISTLCPIIEVGCQTFPEEEEESKLILSKTQPISILPYRMASTELGELKS